MFAGKVFGSLVATAVMLVATTLSTTASAADGCGDPHRTELTRTFEIDVRPQQAVYEVGDRGVFRLTVTRVVDGEAIGPAEGARVGFVARVGDTKVASGVSVTDAAGEAVIKSRIKRHTSPGWADVWAHAEKETADLPCHWDLEREFGDAELRHLFKVR